MVLNTIHLVLGVSSAGKSSFIKQKVINGEWERIPVVMAHEIKEDFPNDIINQECIIHYNLLRPFKNDVININNQLSDDEVLIKILNLSVEIKIYFVILHERDLFKRILLRTSTEEFFRPHAGLYPNIKIFELLCKINIHDLYQRYIRLFDRYNLEKAYFRFDNNECHKFQNYDEAFEYLSMDKKVLYKQEEIEFILKNNTFEYQKIQLPYNISTLGRDRHSEIYFEDQDLSGKSVLDVGCAYGYHCFEAESRNARQVVGVELKKHRYIGANIIKQIIGSKVVFIEEDILAKSFESNFDIILLLNVIHHLIDPITIIRFLAKKCVEKLIIEFPTLSDEKFLSSISGDIQLNHDLPLIGVSLIEGLDQTFVFNKIAIDRILKEHENLFANISYYKSPDNENRCIAVCVK